jgi:hypothetical protein
MTLDARREEYFKVKDMGRCEVLPWWCGEGASGSADPCSAPLELLRLTLLRESLGFGDLCGC